MLKTLCVCVFFWEIFNFMETVLSSGALLISSSLTVCSADMVLQQHEDGRSIKGRETVVGLVLKVKVVLG